MFYLVGDFVRLGNTTKDPYHSVSITVQDSAVVSMNRIGRRTWTHVWQIVHMADGTPDQLVPVTSWENQDTEFNYRRNEPRVDRNGRIVG